MKLKILHCPTTVGGNPQGLVSAERALGYDSESMAFIQNYFNYQADKFIIKNAKPNLLDEGRVMMAAFKSLMKYDVLHYNFGKSFSPTRDYPHTNTYPGWKIFLYSDVYAKFLELWDVKAAHFLNKVVAVTFQGDDARQGDFCDANYPIHPGQLFTNGYYNASSDQFKRKRIETFDRYADIIYGLNPDLMNVLPARAKFLPYANVDPQDWTPVYNSDTVPDVPHIVHAPSNRQFKGTQFVQEALDRLTNEGVSFRYTFVEGMARDEARKIYETADLLIDQVLAGYYGGLAVELMALGKPVVCYMREEDMHHLPDGMWEDMPVINANPNTLYDVLKDYLTTKKHTLRDIGIRSRAYVEKWHDPLKIAKEITQDYELVAARKFRQQRARS